MIVKPVKYLYLTTTKSHQKKESNGQWLIKKFVMGKEAWFLLLRVPKARLFVVCETCSKEKFKKISLKNKHFSCF